MRLKVLVLCCVSVLAAADPATDADRRRFLAAAEVVAVERLAEGLTGSRRATLELAGQRLDAHIQTVDQRWKKLTTRRGVERDLVDSYRFNVAAYRLDRLIGLHAVPVSIVRDFEGKPASYTWWVDDRRMSEAERIERGIDPPNPEAWNGQMRDLIVFNELIANIDPNAGNLLITRDWRLVPIDFTRSFRPDKKLRNPRAVQGSSDHIREGVEGLTAETLEDSLGDLLERREIRGLLARRDAVLKRLSRNAAERRRSTYR